MRQSSLLSFSQPLNIHHIQSIKKHGMQKVESDCPFKHFCELTVGFHLDYSLIINLYLISVTSDLTHFYFNSILDTITFQVKSNIRVRLCHCLQQPKMSL